MDTISRVEPSLAAERHDTIGGSLTSVNTAASKRPINFNRARLMALHHLPASEEALGLAECLTLALEAWEKATGRRKYSRNGKKRDTLAQTVGRVAADLLIADQREPGNHSYRPMGRDLFAGSKSPVSYRMCRTAYEGLKALGYIEVRAAAFIDREFGHSRAERVVGSPEFFALAQSYGIDLQGADTFFQLDLHLPVAPPAPLALTGSRTSPKPWEEYRQPTRKIAFKETRQTRAIAAEVEELTAFMANFELTGAKHRGFRRVFHCGEEPDFRWNKGGRVYSPGEGNYQVLNQRERGRLLLDGKPVIELDVKASYLTVLLAFLGSPLDPDQDGDPYSVEGLPRPVVKAWVAVATGLGRPPTRWPKRATEALRAKEGIDVGETRAYSASNVGKAIIERHPVLANWSTAAVSWPDLMYLESEGIVQTMLALTREYGLPSLPVHDSLIVQKDALETAQMILKREYERATGAQPIIAVGKGASDPEDTVEEAHS